MSLRCPIYSEWVTAENSNEILARHSYPDNIDLLSLDMDGVDYWMLDSLYIHPLVMVLEYNQPSFKAKSLGWFLRGFARRV